MNSTQTSPAEAPPPVDLRPHVVAYLANNLRTNGYEHHARTMEALAALRVAGEPVAVLRYEHAEAGRENEMPRVVSCNRLPDGDHHVYAAPQASAEGVPQGWKAVPERPTGDMLDAMLAPWLTGNRSEREALEAGYAGALQAAPAAVDSAIGSDESDMGRWASFADRRQRDADENDREAWAADMIAAGAQHLGGDDWEWDVEDFQFRLWQQAMRRQQRGGDQDGRAAFEAWRAERYMHTTPWDADLGEYPDGFTQAQWKAWKGCRAALAAQPAMEPVCRTLSDQDMDRVAGWLGKHEAGDIGFQGLCDRIIKAFSVPAGQPAANKVAPTDEQLIALAREVATDATAEQVKLYGHLWVRLCRMALARYSYGMAAHKPDGGDAKDADPLQGAADWLVAVAKQHPTEIAARLLIGYNRAERLYDAAISAQQRQEAGANNA